MANKAGALDPRTFTAHQLVQFMSSNFLPRPPWGRECEQVVRTYGQAEKRENASATWQAFWADDGAKHLCEPKRTLAHPCRVVSIGSNGDASFETQIHALSPHCSIDTWDGTLFGARKKLRYALPAFINFHAQNMDNDTWKAYARPPGEAPMTVNILKIDCEGCEFESLPAFLEHVCVTQILLEVHGCRCGRCFRLHSSVRKSMNSSEAWWRFERVNSLMTLLTRTHRIYKAVPNTRFSDGTCVEYSLQRRTPCGRTLPGDRLHPVL